MLSADKLYSCQTRLLTFWLSGEKDRMPLMSICSEGWAGGDSKLAGTVGGGGGGGGKGRPSPALAPPPAPDRRAAHYECPGRRHSRLGAKLESIALACVTTRPAARLTLSMLHPMVPQPRRCGRRGLPS